MQRQPCRNMETVSLCSSITRGDNGRDALSLVNHGRMRRCAKHSICMLSCHSCHFLHKAGYRTRRTAFRQPIAEFAIQTVILIGSKSRNQYSFLTCRPLSNVWNEWRSCPCACIVCGRIPKWQVKRSRCYLGGSRPSPDLDGILSCFRFCTC